MQLASHVQMLSQEAEHLNKPALTNPLLKAAMASLVRRVLARHLSPLGATAEDPKYAVQNRPRVVPWTASVIRSSQGRKIGSTNAHCSSDNSQRPAIAIRRDALSNSSLADFDHRNVYEIGTRDRMRRLVSGEIR